MFLQPSRQHFYFSFVNSRSLNFTSISQSHRFSCFYCWSCPCIIMINKSRHGVHREGLPVLNYKLSQVLFCPNYKVSAWKWGKTFFKKMSYDMPLKWSWVISVMCGKLAKTCRNTVCSWLVRVRKGFNVIPCISFTFHCTLLWPRLENHLQKNKQKKVKEMLVSSKQFYFHPVCSQLSFVNRTMQHITVNLVLFEN